MINLCLQKIEEAYKAAETIYGRTFQRPKVVFDLRGRSGGQAWGRKNLIRLNPELLRQNGMEFVNRTPTHEASHLIAWEIYGFNISGHGKEWQKVMVDLGQVPSRTHNYENKIGHEYVCACRTAYFTTKRHNLCLKGQEYSCGFCKKTFNYKKWLTVGV